MDRIFEVEHDAPRVRLERPQPGGAPIVFDGSVKGETLSGKFSGLGTTADFTLRRRGRERPRFHREQAVTFKNGGVTLSGTRRARGGIFRASPRLTSTRPPTGSRRGSTEDRRATGRDGDTDSHVTRHSYQPGNVKRRGNDEHTPSGTEKYTQSY